MNNPDDPGNADPPIKLVAVTVYPSPIEAHMARARLSAFDIEAHVTDEHMAALNPLMVNALGGVRLLVHEKDLEAARTILASTENDSETGSDIQVEDVPQPNDGHWGVCTQCGSTHVSPGGTFWKANGWKANLLIAALGAVFLILQGVILFIFFVMAIAYFSGNIFTCNRCGKVQRIKN